MKKKRYISDVVLSALTSDSLSSILLTMTEATTTLKWLLKRHNYYLLEHLNLESLIEIMDVVVEELDDEGDRRQIDIFKIGGSE